MSDYQSPQLTAPVLVPPASAARVGSWFPVSPDRIEPARGLSAAILAGSFFLGAFAPALPVPALSWAPKYADAVSRPTLLTAQQQAFTTGNLAPILPVPPLSWAPVYPDAVTRPWVLTAEQQAFAFAPRPEVLVALSWAPHYPAFARGPQRLTTAAQLAFTLPPFVTPPHLSWAAHYPDRIEPPQGLRASLQQAFVAGRIDDTPYDPAQLGWFPHWPDWQLRPWPQTSLGFVVDRIDTRRIIRVCVVHETAGQPAILDAASGQPAVMHQIGGQACVTGTAPDCEST